MDYNPPSPHHGHYAQYAGSPHHGHYAQYAGSPHHGQHEAPPQTAAPSSTPSLLFSKQTLRHISNFLSYNIIIGGAVVTPLIFCILLVAPFFVSSTTTACAKELNGTCVGVFADTLDLFMVRYAKNTGKALCPLSLSCVLRELEISKFSASYSFNTSSEGSNSSEGLAAEEYFLSPPLQAVLSDLKESTSKYLPLCGSLYDVIPQGFQLIAIDCALGAIISLTINFISSTETVSRKLDLLSAKLLFAWNSRKRSRNNGGQPVATPRAATDVTDEERNVSRTLRQIEESEVEEDELGDTEMMFLRQLESVQRERASKTQMPFVERCFRTSPLLGIKCFVCALLSFILAIIQVATYHHSSSRNGFLVSNGAPVEASTSWEKYNMLSVLVFNKSMTKPFVQYGVMATMQMSIPLWHRIDRALMLMPPCSLKHFILIAVRNVCEMIFLTLEATWSILENLFHDKRVASASMAVHPTGIIFCTSFVIMTLPFWVTNMSIGFVVYFPWVATLSTTIISLFFPMYFLSAITIRWRYELPLPQQSDAADETLEPRPRESWITPPFQFVRLSTCMVLMTIYGSYNWSLPSNLATMLFADSGGAYTTREGYFAIVFDEMFLRSQSCYAMNAYANTQSAMNAVLMSL